MIFTFMKKTLFHWKQLLMCAISFCLPAIGNSFFFISEKILAIFGMISLISVKCIVYIPLNSHKEFQQWQKVMGIFICSITLVYQNVQKWWKISQSNTLKKTWQKKNIALQSRRKHYAPKLFIHAQKLLQVTYCALI